MNKSSSSFQNFNQVEILHIHKTNLKKKLKKTKEKKSSESKKKHGQEKVERNIKNSAKMEER